jgi:menaquinone-specific isochorismate synthase
MKCRVFEVAEDIDLNAVCAGDGFLFAQNNYGHAGRDVAAVADGATIASVLSSIDVTPDSVAFSPLAFGLVPFLPTENAMFFIPRILFSKDESGRTTLTLCGDTDEDISTSTANKAIADVVAVQPPLPQAQEFNVRPLTPIQTYLHAVTNARDAVKRGAIRKAVIARDIGVTSNTPIDIHGVLLRLRASFGSSYRFCIDNMVGASPELLVEIDGRTVRSRPLAGTTPRTGDPETDARLAAQLKASEKNQIEHRVVIDMVHDTLLPHCSYLDWEDEPSIVTVANVQHLGTYLEGALTEPAAHILDLVRALCPTPALGGSPSKEAIEFIVENEGFERGFYGGAVGWVNADGDGTFAVTIRCAELSPDRTTARLFAGGGIVADSEPLAELAETQSKFQAMLSAIIRP